MQIESNVVRSKHCVQLWVFYFGFSRFFFLLNTLVGLSRSYLIKHRKLKRKKPDLCLVGVRNKIQALYNQLD